MDGDDINLAQGQLRCTIERRGAQLRSLVDTRCGEEYLWQRDPLVWSDSAPILFPVVGRLRDGRYRHGGREYRMPIHGFARMGDFVVTEMDGDGATFELVETAATLAQYPFRFLLRVRFTLEPHCLHVAYEVENRNGDVMPFSLGSHPGFRLPPSRGGLNDWALLFSEQEDPLCYRLDNGLLAREATPFRFESGNRIVLSPTLFDADALIFKGVRSRHVRLVHRNGRVRLSVATGGAPDLGLWARPGAPYVCIEPWFGYDDEAGVSAISGGCGELGAKPGINLLAAGAVFKAAYSINVPPWFRLGQAAAGP